MLQEDELRKEGGKYAHLNDELHVFVEVFSEMTDNYARLAHAVAELKKFLQPVSICMLEWIKVLKMLSIYRYSLLSLKEIDFMSIQSF